MMDLKTTACVLGAAFAVSAAQANRPLNTDTADTITPHRCQLEPYGALNRSPGSPSERSTVVQLNCGVASTTQIGLAYTHAASDDEQTQLVSLGGKTQLIPLQDARTGVSLGYGVNAAKVAGARWSHELATVYLIATREIAPGLLVHANLGTAHSRSARQQSTTWAAAFEWSAWPRVVWSGETYGDDRSPPWIGTGLWWGAGANFSLNVSLGVQRSEPRTRQVTAGFNIEF